MNKTYKLSTLLSSMPLVLLYRLLLVMILYTIARGIFYFYNVEHLHFADRAEVLYAFWGGLRFDLSAMLYVNALVLLLHLLPIPWKYNSTYQRVCSWIYWLFNIPAFILNLGDVIYYRFTGGRTTLSVFSEFSNENPLHFLRFFIDYWHLTLTGLVLIALWVWLYRLVKPAQALPLRTLPFYTLSTLTLALATYLSIGGLRGGFLRVTRPIAPNHASAYTSRPEQRAMVLNTPFTMIRLAGKEALPRYSYFSQEEGHKLFNAEQKTDTSSPLYATFRGRNVVIIIWESLAREWVGTLNQDIEGYEGFTPFVDSLMRQSYYFVRASASGTKSIDAMPNIFASIPRPITPFVSSPYSGNRVNSIAMFARKYGYKTRFYHNAPNGSMGFDAMARQLGFEEYRGKDEYNNDEDYDGYWGIWDEEFLQYIAQDLNNLPQPFLASEFTTSSHSPFIIPERYHSRFPEGQVPMHRSIRYSDYALEQFFKLAKKQPWYENTLFVITADHAVQGWLDEYKNSVGAHAIPLIIFDPQGKLQGVDSTTLAQQADIFPTLMSLLGFDERFVSFGRSIFTNDSAQNFSINCLDNAYQMQQGDYVLQFDGTRVLGLYNVRQDRGLKHNLQDTQPVILQSMLPYMKAYLQDFSYRMHSNKLSLE